MNDFAIKNYNSGKNSILNKIKMVAFVLLCFGTGCGILATVCEYGHAMQMERIATASE